MEQINNIEEVIASAIDGIMIIYLLNCCFVKTQRIKYIYSFFCWILLFILAHWLGQYFLIQSITLILVVAIYCYFVLKAEPVRGIIAGVAVNVGLALVNMVIMFLISMLSGHRISELVDAASMSRVAVLILSKISFMFAGVLVVNTISHFVRFKMFQWVYICIYYIATFMICVLVSTLLLSGNFNDKEKLIMLFIFMFIVIVNILTYFLIVHINNENRLEMEHKMLNVQIGNQHNMIEKTSELYEETRALRHDMKHYFTTFGEMLRHGDTELVMQEMDKIVNIDLNNVQIINLSNSILNAAINDKLNVCRRMDIKTDIKISGTVSENMSMDMALIISNLMDNAIEAQANLKEKFIKLAMQEDFQNIILEVRNNINRPVLKQGEELITHKKDKLRHGYGVKNVKRIIRKYDGYIDIREEGQHFVVTIIVPA